MVEETTIEELEEEINLEILERAFSTNGARKLLTSLGFSEKKYFDYPKYKDLENCFTLVEGDHSHGSKRLFKMKESFFHEQHNLHQQELSVLIRANSSLYWRLYNIKSRPYMEGFSYFKFLFMINVRFIFSSVL